jgi:amidohydrolase
MEPVADTGLLARVGPAGDAVVVRAELDALPIKEETDAPFAAAATSPPEPGPEA